MKKRVFISYRREDSGSAAGRIYDRLRSLLSDDYLFFDVSTIAGGEDFAARTVSAVRRSNAVLVFIGEKWLDPLPNCDRPRIWDPNDFVRTEVREALASPALVLPILVNKATMPKPELLPDGIKPLTFRNAMQLRHERFDDDTEEILAAIFGRSKKPRPGDRKGRLVRKVVYGATCAMLAGTALAIIAFVHMLLLSSPLSSSITAPATELLLLVIPCFGAWLGLKWEAWAWRRKSS